MPTRQRKRKKTDNKVADVSRYPIEVFYSDEDGGFIAIAKDLPGCSAFGKTQAKAVAEIPDAIKAWQEAAKAVGNPVPEPSRHADGVLPSGKILLRVPRTLHASLIECAKKELVSLNQHLVSVLSLSVGMTLFRETQGIVESMQNLVPMGAGLALMPTPVRASGTSWHMHGGSENPTIIRPGEALDVRTLPAGKPVVREVG